MMKKLGKFIAATAVIGTAVAGGIALYNKYKASQEDLDDDFIDFDDDFDDDIDDDIDTSFDDDDEEDEYDEDYDYSGDVGDVGASEEEIVYTSEEEVRCPFPPLLFCFDLN